MVWQAITFYFQKQHKTTHVEIKKLQLIWIYGSQLLNYNPHSKQQG